jgi:DNA-binding beta-propeller fold protein YncE
MPHYTNTEHSLQITQNHTSIILILGLGLFALLTIGITYSNVFAFENATVYKFVKKWGEEGKGDGQFQRPHDLDFSPDEKILYAVDRDGNRVQAFDKNGTFLFTFGGLGTGDGQFHVPYSIDVDVDGNVLVADRANDRIQKFTSTGKFILKFGNTDLKPSEDLGKFDNPRHVAVDKELR